MAQCTYSLLGVTSLLIDNNLVWQLALPAASSIFGPRTALNIKTIVTGVIGKRNLDGKVDAFVFDNAQNMTNELQSLKRVSSNCRD